MADNGTVEMSSHKGNVQHSGEEIVGGYPQAQSVRGLDRYITLKPAVGFGLTTQSSWVVIGVTLGAGLLNGGPTAMVYGSILVTIGTLLMAASLGELASIDPVVGAQYRWTARYAPSVMKPEFWGLMQGWLTVFAWIFLCGGAPFIGGLVIQGLIIFNDETYVPKQWHATLLAWAYLMVPFLWNVYGRKLLKAIEIIGGIFYIVFFIVTIVTLVVMAPRNPSEFVFKTSFFGLSGWQNEGVQWSLGLLTISAVLIGFDGVIHLAAEVTDAPRKVPRAMVLSVGINGILAFGFILAVLFCMGDVESTTLTPTGFPIIEVYYQATGSKAGTNVLVCMLIIAATISIFGLFASTARLTWAFANDRGLPFSDFFARVHPTLRIPLNALVLVTLVSALLPLINLGSTTALFNVLALSTLGLYFSYLLPIFFILLRKLKGQHPAYGPFCLGRFGIPINILALCYGIYIIIFLPFPTVLPVTAADMNYAGPILGGVMLLALADYLISGRKRFILPVDKVEYDSNHSR